MIEVVRVPLAFLKRDFLNESSYKLHFMMQLAGIFFSTVTFHFLAKLIGENFNAQLKPYGGNYFSFVLIGLAFSNYLQVSLQGFSKVIREAQVMGIMEALLVTETSVRMIILSSSLYNFLVTSLRVLVYLLLGIFLFSMDLQQANYPGAVAILLLAIPAFSCLGIISASFIVVMKKGDPLSWLISSLSWLIGGVYYPIAVLPDWLQHFSYLLPIRYALEGMRLALLQGASWSQLLPNLLPLFLFSTIMLPLSLLAFQFAVQKAKIDGTLTQY
jgi:ABC-2 type transport system permease protein